LSMLYSFLVAAGVIFVLMTVWVAVQLAWKKQFPESGTDQDALSGRAGCHGCALDEYCETRDKEPGRGSTSCDLRAEQVPSATLSARRGRHSSGPRDRATEG